MMPTFDPRISWGNLLVALTTLATMAMVVGALRAETASHAVEISDHEARLRVLENTVTGSLATIQSQLAQIQKELSR